MKVRRLLAFGVIIVGLMAFGVSLVSLVHADPDTPEAILAGPTDDTYVLDQDATVYGSDLYLYVIRDCIADSPLYISFLKFEMPAPSASYRLVLFNTDQTFEAPPEISLYGATTNWTENDLDWFDLGDLDPPGGTVFFQANLLGKVNGVAKNTLIEFNNTNAPTMTTYINAQRGLEASHVAFALVATSCPSTYPDQAYCSKENGDCPPPLSVELASLALTGGNAWVEVTWTTASETDNEGFNIYRSESTDGEFVKVNDALIAARGNASTGATYTFTDEGVNNGVMYYYRLEAISTDGQSKFFDLGSVTPRRPGKGR